MRTESGTDAAQVGAAVLPWLERDPVLNNLPATVLGGLLAGDVPVPPEHGFRWALVRVGGHVAGIALCNPPWPVVVAAGGAGVAATLADRLAADGCAAPGVTGPVAVAEGFASRWCSATGALIGDRVGLLVYRLDEVVPPVGVPGAARVAGAADRELLLGWARAFDREIHLGGGGDAATMVDVRLGPGRLRVWEADGRPVAMGATSARVAGVPRINLVYTPPELRGRGYASALVAEISSRELASGAVACTLNAEVANPTSNRIYRRIGYRPVGEVAAIRFDRASAGAPLRTGSQG